MASEIGRWTNGSEAPCYRELRNREVKEKRTENRRGRLLVWALPYAIWSFPMSDGIEQQILIEHLVRTKCFRNVKNKKILSFPKHLIF